MKQELFGAFVLSPLQVLSNLEGAVATNEQLNVALFRAPSYAFGYIQKEASFASIPAHTIGMGKNANEFFKLPGMGVMYRLNVPDSVLRQMGESTLEERYHGMVCKGDMTGATIMERQAVFVSDEFHNRPVEIVPMPQAIDEMKRRAKNYEPLDIILKNTPASVRATCSPQFTSPEALQMSVGLNAPSQNGFTTEYPQDQKFWDMYKMLWENKAGIQYLVDALPIMYNQYRDGYARGIVRDESPELAAAKAVVTVLNWTQERARQYHDTRMEDILQDAGEDAVLEVCQIEHDEQSNPENFK